MRHHRLHDPVEVRGDRRPSVILFDQSAGVAAELLAALGSRSRAMVWRAKSAGSSARMMFSPWLTGSPSAPSVVETTAFPMAIASKILMRVPLPLRRGTTQTAALARYGRMSSTARLR